MAAALVGDRSGFGPRVRRPGPLDDDLEDTASAISPPFCDLGRYWSSRDGGGEGVAWRSDISRDTGD